MNLGNESEIKEFKETTSELEEALIDMTAILNKHGHGEIYFGVKDNGEVKGMQIGKDTKRDISRKIYEKIKPQIYPVVEELTDEDKKYIKVEFSGISKPYSCDGKYYVRVIDESRELSPLELVNFILNANYKKWEQMVSDCTIDDVDINALKAFYKKATEIKRLPKFEFDEKLLLSKLGLLYDDGFHLNNAGKMLFSSKKPIILKMAVFATNEKKTFIDMSQIEGNIFELIEEAEQYVKKNIRWSVEIVGFNRIEKPEIPIEALREIIVNSFAHGNYIGTSRHEIDIHPDRVSIYNPGSFPDGLIPEDFKKKNISSKIRNEIICNVLFRCGEIESWSTGLRKVFDLCEENNVKVAYEKEYDGFWFFFIRDDSLNVIDKDATNVVTKETKNASIIDLSELEKKILATIQRNPKANRDSLSQETGRTSRHIQRALDDLKEKRLIERVGSRRDGHWKINE